MATKTRKAFPGQTRMSGERCHSWSPLDRNSFYFIYLVVSRWLLAGILALAASRSRADIPVVELTGVVHAVSAAHVVSAIERADAQGAPLLILRLDTPGGLDTSMRQIVDRMLNCKTPVAVFVGPSGARAASAGFIITVAADVAAMAPGTNLGAAHPVSATGGMDEVMAKKVTSDAAAYIRGKAERRGRNVEMAEKAVVESQSFTEKEALDLKLIDLVAQDVPDLVARLEGREVKRFDGSQATLRLAGQKTVTVAMDWRQMVLSAIASPEVLFLLLLGALAGLGAELSHPGMLFPGIVGMLCLILFLFASQVIPVNGAGVLLVLLALGLFVAEVKVASYGLLTASGLVAMVLGAMMLVDAPIPEMRISLATLLPATLVMAGGTIALVRMVLAAQRLRPTTGAEAMIGLPGRAETELRPEGWVRVRGERWRARAEAEVALGGAVEVTALDGLSLRVRGGA
jgi:membrane-bound serine protease (ClpP class)